MAKSAPARQMREQGKKPSQTTTPASPSTPTPTRRRQGQTYVGKSPRKRGGAERSTAGAGVAIPQ